MRREVVALLSASALLLGVSIGYLLWGRKAAEGEEKLFHTRMELEGRVENLKARLAEAEKRLKEEEATRKNLERIIHEAGILK